MKQIYKSPTVYSYELETASGLLIGSIFKKDEVPKGYACPHRLTLYCQKYSEHMNEYEKPVAKSKSNFAFYADYGCPYKEACDLYKKFYNVSQTNTK